MVITFTNIKGGGGGGEKYYAGNNIEITSDNIINVTGITLPTKVSELVNDEGYITTADTQNFVTSGDVQTQINDSISGKADSSAVTAQISEVKAEIEAKIPSKVSDLQNDLNFASTGDVESMISGFTTSADVKTQIEGYNYINYGQAQTQIDNSISGKLDTDIFTAYTANTKTELNNKQDISGMTEYATTAFTESTYAKIGDIPTKTSDLTNDSGFITDAALSGYATEQYVDNSVSGKVDNSALTQYYTSAQTDTAISNATSGKQDTLVSGTNIKTINNESLLGSGNIVIQGGSGGGSYTAGNNIDITNDVISVTGLATINGSAITEGGNIVIQGGGGSGGGETVIELTQAQYDALTEYAQDTTYIITDAPSVDLDNYYTSAQTESAITAQTSLKQDTLVSGTNIKTINSQSILGSGDIYISQGINYNAGAGLNLINGNTFEVKDYENLKQGARLGEIEKVISIALNDLNNRLKNLK